MENVRVTKLFSAFCAHYNFAYSFCNPDSGHEKGNVEGKVGFIRRNALTPPPRMDNIDAYNARLLQTRMGLSKMHYAKGEPEEQLLVEDRFALLGLPETPFDVVRYERRKADLQGKVTLCGNHRYSSSPALAKQELICALRATQVEIYTEGGEFIACHTRQYGDAPTISLQVQPAAGLPFPIQVPLAARESNPAFPLRSIMPK